VQTEEGEWEEKPQGGLNRFTPNPNAPLAFCRLTAKTGNLYLNSWEGDDCATLLNLNDNKIDNRYVVINKKIIISSCTRNWCGQPSFPQWGSGDILGCEQTERFFN
jgi:hypothetical protein